MALVLKDRVKETTTTTGTGTITLAGAATGYQSFSAIGNANSTYYCIAGGSEWEVGIGTYTASGTTLSRDTILSSSNSGSAVNFSAGTKDVFVVYPAGKAVYGLIDPVNVNVAVGDNTLTAGTDNTAVGSYTLNANTTGNKNVAVGTYALISNTTGIGNVAVGWDVMDANSTGSENTAVGNAALFSNAASYNTSVGSGALAFNTTGDYNAAVGFEALKTSTTGRFCSALGDSALYSNTTGGSNTAVGAGALYTNSTGNNNTAVGLSSLQENTANDNTAVGRLSLFTNTTGTRNVAVGANALDANTTANDNVAVGYAALGASTTGATNTAIGPSSGSAITTGSKNSILGAYTGNQGGLDIRTASNYIVLSDGDGNPRWISDNNGATGYGPTTGGADTQATSRTTGVTINKPTGSITLVSAAGSTSWQSFTVTNSTVTAKDVVVVNQKSGTDLYMIHVTNVAAGSFQVTFATTGGTTTEQPVFNFAVIKGQTT